MTREAKADTNPSRRWMRFISSFKMEQLIMTSCYSNSYTRRSKMTQVPSLPVTASVLSYRATRCNIHGNIVSMASKIMACDKWHVERLETIWISMTVILHACRRMNGKNTSHHAYSHFPGHHLIDCLNLVDIYRAWLYLAAA